MDTNSSKNALSIPLAIVVAGLLIAGALYFSRGGMMRTTTPNTQEEPALTQDIKIRAISESEHALGNPEAPLAVVVYTDTECPFCKTFHNTMKKVAESYGKTNEVLWVYRQFPLEQLHPKAPNEAEATECAAELGGNKAFWDYVNKIFEVTPSNNGLDEKQLPAIAKEIGLDSAKFTTCLSSGKFTDKVQEDVREAVVAGGRGTPYSVIVSKKSMSDKTLATLKNLTVTLPPDTILYSSDKRHIGVSGALPYTLMQQILDTLLGK